MYLTSSKAVVLSNVMRILAEPHEEKEVRRHIGDLMLDLLDADYYASYVWSDAQRCFNDRVALNMSDRNLSAYESYYQFHDPITLSMQARREPTLVIQVMPQHDLVRTEFFNDFLYRDGLYWGVNLYAWDGDQNIGDMRIWRNKRRENFNEDTLGILELIRPAFVAALKRAGASAQPEPASTTQATALAIRLPSTLSEREREIVQLVALGWSDKDIARRLGIGFTTVRTHIGHAFRKLGVDNRVQLVGAARSQLLTTNQ